MKSLQLALILATLLSASLRASSPEYTRMVQERDATLSRIVTLQEERFRSGLSSPEAFFAARLALATFRRDVAATPAEKIVQQKLIVGWREDQLADIKARMAAGVTTEEDLLRVTDELLAAKLALLEIAEKH